MSTETLKTRDRLLAGAISLMEEGGEAAVRVESVASLAGVTRPSLYHFFGDRDGLVIAAQGERYRQSLFYQMVDRTELTRQCESRDDFKNLIRDWLKSLMDADGERRRAVRTEVLGSSVARPRLRALVREIDTQASRELGVLLQVAKERDWISIPFDLDVAATWWFGMMNGRYMVEGDAPSLFRREWDDIATQSVMFILFGNYDEAM
jgi:AcrR family transcriptional regulator